MRIPMPTPIPMTPAILPLGDINSWLLRNSPTNLGGHLPNRIRILWANLPSLDRRLGTSPEPDPPDPMQIIRRRCDTDAIWEGRLAALRWLIEFIGIKPAPPHETDACSVWNFPDAEAFNPGPDFDFLRDMWTSCTKASSHSTHNSGHTPITNAEFERARDLIAAHLNRTIYKNTGTTVEDEALQPSRRGGITDTCC